MQIFLDDTDYSQFVYLLGEVTEQFNVECRNYCLMPNHYHVALLPNEANLSAAIRVLNGEYAQWWNKRHQRVGHVMQGRFKAQIVQCNEYYLTLCRYIDLNPVRARLVEDPDLWVWSSYGATIGLRPSPAFLSVEPTLFYFGSDDVQILRSRYRDFVVTAAGHSGLEDRVRSNDRVLGDSAFKRRILGARSAAAGCAAALGAVPRICSADPDPSAVCLVQE